MEVCVCACACGGHSRQSLSGQGQNFMVLIIAGLGHTQTEFRGPDRNLCHTKISHMVAPSSQESWLARVVVSGRSWEKPGRRCLGWGFAFCFRHHLHLIPSLEPAHVSPPAPFLPSSPNAPSLPPSDSDTALIGGSTGLGV